MRSKASRGPAVRSTATTRGAAYSSAPLNTAKDASTRRGAFDRARAINTHQIMISPMKPDDPELDTDLDYVAVADEWRAKLLLLQPGDRPKPIPRNHSIGDDARQLSTAANRSPPVRYQKR